MNLSVVVIARDAAKTLSACIGSVKNIADEIVVVVDDRTSDETIQLAESLGARVFVRRFANFADQKNYAQTKTKGDWVLSLDADETVSPQLADEVVHILSDTDKAAFYIPRLNIIFGKPMYHTNWEPVADTHIWLWRKEVGQWVGKVHEEVLVRGEVQKLKGQKIHYNYQTVEEFITKMNGYTSKETVAVNPVYDFLRRYVWHLGFLDGWHGLFLSYLMFIYYLVVWVKLWQKKNISWS